MSLEQGLEVLRSNYEVATLVETDREVVVTTYAYIQGAERLALSRLGWVIQDDHTVVFTKELVDVDEEVLPPDGPPEKPETDLVAENPPPDQPDLTETE
jgi:hypothetical protein